MTSKRELFIWKKHHDLLLLKEVVLEEPFKHNNGSKEKCDELQIYTGMKFFYGFQNHVVPLKHQPEYLRCRTLHL